MIEARQLRAMVARASRPLVANGKTRNLETHGRDARATT